MENKSRLKIYGILGYPLSHSLSPVMHNAAFKYLNLDAEYRPFEVKPEDLDNFLEGLAKNNLYGLNITVPYKERIFDFISLDPLARHLKELKAVNTIAREGSFWKGFNTDILGFARHLKENFNPLNKKAAILGAGGAARAVAYVLADAGASEIALFDIEREKSRNVMAMIKSLFPHREISAVESLEELEIKNKDLLVNATPVGLKESDPSPIKENMLHRGLFVYDLIYNPQETKLLAEAQKAGAKTANGLGMLLYQGMLSFEIWTGKIAPQEVMRQALLKNTR